MKSKFTFLLVLVALSLISLSPASGSHLMGGEITYHWRGGNTYHIVFTLYRDCKGIAAPVVLNINLVSTCGDNISAIANLVSGTGTDINPACQGVLTTCHGGGTAPGFQKWQYFIDYTLPHTCSDWRFSANLGSRSTVSTIGCPSTCNLYVEAHLNNTLFNHDSPQFLSDPQTMVCVNTPYLLDCSTNNSDCDSISYSFTCAKTAANTCVNYTSGYDSLHFISSSPPPSIGINTGIISINPTAIEVAVYVVLVRQYRNGTLIGSVMRDIQIYTQHCSSINHLPQLSGINGTNQYSLTISANKSTCFNIFSSDSDTAQSTTLSWVPFSNATLTLVDTSHYEDATFCWTPLITDTGSCPRCFSIKVMDNNCQYKGFKIQPFCLTVVDSGYFLNVINSDIKNEVTVTPNPFSNHTTIKIHSASVLQAQFILYDVFGRMLMSKKMEENEIVIDGSSFATGIYYYSIEYQNKLLASGKLNRIQ